MPGDISRSSKGPRSGVPLIPPWIERMNKEAQVAEEKKDDNIIEVPADFAETMIERTHMVVRNEAVVTCRLDLMEPQKYVGKDVACPKCGEVFHVIRPAGFVQPAA